jgi:hypothetical protein
MQGEPFLGKAETKPREYVFGHRDRVDEVIDMSRSVRTKRYLYIRNYMPHLGWNQPSAWPDQGEIRHEFYRLASREKMTDAQWQFARPTRPYEELYDCENDPHNLTNLASSDDYVEIRRRLNGVNQVHRERTRDVGVLAEPELVKIAGKENAWDAARNGQIKFSIMAIGGIDGETVIGIPLYTAFKDPLHGYWSHLAYSQREKIWSDDVTHLTKALDNESFVIRLASAQSLAHHGHIDKALPTLIAEVDNDDLTQVLYAARAIELLGDDAKAATGAMEKALARAEKIRPPDTPATVVTSGDADLAMFIGFSTRAFLKKVKREEEQEGVQCVEDH